MLTGSTFSTALLRALYAAIITGALAGITAYQQDSNGQRSIITGVAAALGVLVMRGGLEGAYDASRQANNKVNTADVQGVPPGQP